MNNKKARGWILRILHRAYPAGMETSSLQKQLYNIGYKLTRTEIARNTAYLHEDGFITEKTFGDELLDELSNKIYRLTTKGVDIVEGSITDDGVEV